MTWSERLRKTRRKLVKKNGRRLLQVVDKEGFVKEFEIVLVTRQGSRIDVLLTVNRTTDEDETPRYEVYIRDITLRKRMEKQMARSEKMASIGQLAAVPVDPGLETPRPGRLHLDFQRLGVDLDLQLLGVQSRPYGDQDHGFPILNQNPT